MKGFSSTRREIDHLNKKHVQELVDFGTNLQYYEIASFPTFNLKKSMHLSDIPPRMRSTENVHLATTRIQRLLCDY